MIIIAETKDGFLIAAARSEVQEIINAVTGTRPEKIVIGQKIPAIDYATTIVKVKALNEACEYRYLKVKVSDFNQSFLSLTEAIDSASKIEV